VNNPEIPQTNYLSSLNFKLNNIKIIMILLPN
jgi:hypothetical protein